MRPNRKVAATLSSVGLIAMLAAAADARAGTYIVRECHNSAPQNHFHEAEAVSFPTPSPYAVAAGPGVCSGAANDYAIRVRPQGDAQQGHFGLAQLTAPAGTSFVGVKLDAKLRSELGHRARLSMSNAAGIEKIRFAAGSSGPAGFAPYSWSAGSGSPDGYARFVASLVCDNPGHPCPEAHPGSASTTEIRNLRLTLRDDVAPTVEMSERLVEGGWIRGEAGLRTDAADAGGGLSFVPTAVNGSVVMGGTGQACSVVNGTAQGSRLAPCPTDYQELKLLDTNSEPFRDGSNQINACAVDFGSEANITCSTHVALVDNSPPELSFRSQLTQDPELVRASASDATSGLQAGSAVIEYRAMGSESWIELPTELQNGEVQARVDSESLPQGNYAFRASIRDVAGNQGRTGKREDGEPMVLRLPLKDSVDLRARLGNGKDRQLVKFRRMGRVAGRLVDTGGQPIPGEPVEVVETFGEGSLLDERRRVVTTDDHGRYRSKLPGGPSRDVEVLYPGSKRYRTAAEQGLDFDVRGAATLKTSKRRIRAGRAVTFRGRVKRYFARIPEGGKLVEIQVKSGRRWTTLQEARGTNRKGRMRLRHRFRGFYTQPVTFIFRLKARRESGWPYRGAATSKRRRVTVIPKR